MINCKLTLEELSNVLSHNIDSYECQSFIKLFTAVDHKSESAEGNIHDDYLFEGVTLNFINSHLMRIEIKSEVVTFNNIPSDKKSVIEIFGDEKDNFFKRDDRLNYNFKNYKIMFSFDKESKLSKLILMSK